MLDKRRLGRTVDATDPALPRRQNRVERRTRRGCAAGGCAAEQGGWRIGRALGTQALCGAVVRLDRQRVGQPPGQQALAWPVRECGKERGKLGRGGGAGGQQAVVLNEAGGHGVEQRGGDRIRVGPALSLDSDEQRRPTLNTRILNTPILDTTFLGLHGGSNSKQEQNAPHARPYRPGLRCTPQSLRGLVRVLRFYFGFGRLSCSLALMLL